MGRIVQAATLQAAALARQQRRRRIVVVPELFLSSSNPLSSFRLPQQLPHYPHLSTARTQRVHDIIRQPLFPSSCTAWKDNDDDDENDGISSAYANFLRDDERHSSLFPARNQRVLCTTSFRRPQSLPSMTTTLVESSTSTAARRLLSSSSSSFSSLSSSEIRESKDNDATTTNIDSTNKDGDDIVISESVNDLETKVMRQMAQRLLLLSDSESSSTSSSTSSSSHDDPGGRYYNYNAHTWFDAEDALKWWSSQRTVESVHICFALLDRFVQEMAASTQQHEDDDNQQQQQQVSTDDKVSSSSSSMNDLASFLDWRLMSAVLGNWAAVWKESIYTKEREKDDDFHHLLLISPRAVLQRLDRYARDHPHVPGFGMTNQQPGGGGFLSANILSHVLNSAIHQSRAILQLRRGKPHHHHHHHHSSSSSSSPWYANEKSSTLEATIAKPFLEDPKQPELSFLSTATSHSKSATSSDASTPTRNTFVHDDNDGDDDAFEMVQFCTVILERLLKHFNDNDDDDDGGNTDSRFNQHAQKRRRQEDYRAPPRSTVYFANSILNLWSHVGSRSETMSDLDQAVQQAEHVFSLSLNNGVALDIISYNTMLDVYAQAGKGHQAESLLQTMFQNWQFHHEHQQQQQRDQQSSLSSIDHHDSQERVVEPDIISFNTTAAAWARSKPSDDAPERLHALWQAMLDPQGYGQLPACRGGITSNVFYNTVLYSWAQSGRPDAGQGAEDFLREMILRSSLSKPTTSSSSSWHDSPYHDDDDAAAVARQQYEQQLPDIISYGTVAYAYAQVGMAQDAERIARELYQAYLDTPASNTRRREALRPTTILLTHVMDAWTRAPESSIQGEDRVARARAVLDDMHRLYEEGIIRDHRPDTWTWNVLLQCIVGAATEAAKSSKTDKSKRTEAQKLMKEALELVEAMKKQPDDLAKPNSWTYSVILIGLVEQERIQQALELLHQVYVVEKVDIDVRTIGRVILAAVSKREGRRIRELEQATMLLHRLLDVCEQDALTAEKDVTRESSSNNKPTASLLGAVVAGWSRVCKTNGNWNKTRAKNARLARQQATSLMERMRRMHEAGYLTEGPDHGIMRLVVSCWTQFSRSDNPPHIKKEAALKALRFLQEMRRMAKSDPESAMMPPDLGTYNEVLCSLARAREPQRAETVLKQMIDDYNDSRNGKENQKSVSKAVKPSADCFNSVLLGWALVSSPNNAEVMTSRAQAVLDGMQKLPLTANRGTYHHMIHVWAQAGRPEIAEDVFRRMTSEYQKELAMAHNQSNNKESRKERSSQPTLQPTTHSYRRIIQAWTDPEGRTGSFNPERAERLLLEMCQWFKSGQNNKVRPFPDCFHMVAGAWQALAATFPDGEQRQMQLRKRAEYISSLERELHPSSSS